MENNRLEKNKNNKSLIKYKIKDTKGDWLFHLALVIAIAAVVLDIILFWNAKKISTNTIIIDTLLLISGLLFLYYHLRYRWQLIVIILYLIFVLVKIIRSIFHLVKLYK